MENPANGDILLNAAQGSGVLSSALFTKSGVPYARKDFTPSWLLQDDHQGNAGYFPAHPSSPRLVLAHTGHGSNYPNGQSKNQIRWQKSVTGALDAFSPEVITTLASAAMPNYSQWLEDAAPASPGYGRAIRLWNDDTFISWGCHYTDDNFATYKKGRKLFAAADGQIYARTDLGAIANFKPAGTGTQAEYVPLYIFPNVQDTTQFIRRLLINLRTGTLVKASNGNLINSGASIFDTTNLDSEIVATDVRSSSATDLIRAPTAGRSQRLNDAHKGILCITDTPGAAQANPFGAGLGVNDPTGARHIVLKNSVEYDVGGAGYPFRLQGYNPDLQQAREPHAGDRFYRCTNDGTAYNSGSKLLRLDYPTGIENGGKVETVVLQAGLTPGIPANYGILRFFPVQGSTAVSGQLCGFALVGQYTDYTVWSNMQFIPVFAP